MKYWLMILFTSFTFFIINSSLVFSWHHKEHPMPADIAKFLKERSISKEKVEVIDKAYLEKHGQTYIYIPKTGDGMKILDTDKGLFLLKK